MAKSKRTDEVIPTRSSLLRRLKNPHDHASWQEFYDTYWNFLCGIAIKCGMRPDEAEDVVQQTLIYASQHMKDFKYDPSRSFKAWLRTNLKWRIADQFHNRLPVSSGSPRSETEINRTATIERIANPDGSYDLDKKWEEVWQEHV